MSGMNKYSYLFNCLVALGLVSAAAPGRAETPSVISGRIETPVVRLQSSPISPKVELHIHGRSDYVGLTWGGPNGQSLSQFFRILAEAGPQEYQMGVSFGAFAAAGSWALNNLIVCTESNCSSYTGSALAALFPSLTMQLINAKSDTVAPVLTAATILTPSVAISNHAMIELSLTMQDDVSGVYYVGVTFGSGTKTSIGFGNTTTHPIVASVTYDMLSPCGCTKLTPGVYPATKITVGDYAGNGLTITDPGTISALFGGQSSITLTN